MFKDAALKAQHGLGLKKKGSRFGTTKTQGTETKPKEAENKLEMELDVPNCNVTVQSGSSTKEFPLANQNVGDVRKILKGILNIADQAIALINGREVPEDQSLRTGDRLEFVRRAGNKG